MKRAVWREQPVCDDHVRMRVQVLVFTSCFNGLHGCRNAVCLQCPLHELLDRLPGNPGQVVESLTVPEKIPAQQEWDRANKMSVGDVTQDVLRQVEFFFERMLLLARGA